MRVSINGTAITGYDDTLHSGDTVVEFPGNPGQYSNFPTGYTVTGSAGSRKLVAPAQGAVSGVIGSTATQVVATELTVTVGVDQATQAELDAAELGDTAALAAETSARTSGDSTTAANAAALVTAHSALTSGVHGVGGSTILSKAQGDAAYAALAGGTFTGDVKFKSGAPVVSLKSFGAVGDAKIVPDAGITVGQSEVSSAIAAFTSADVGKKLTILDAGAALGTPVAPTLATATTLGTLAPATYAYRIGAVSPGGGVNLGPEATIVVPAGTSTNTVTISWTPVPGASWHILYGRTSGGELFLAPLHPSTTSFVDRGYYTPSGALPTGGTAASAFAPLVGIIQSVAAGVATINATAGNTVTNQRCNYGTDSTAACLAAAAVAHFVGLGGAGGTILAERGRYLISAPIGIWSNVHFQGSGSAQVGYDAAGYTGTLFVASGDFVADETSAMLRFLDTYPPANHAGAHGYQHWSRFKRVAVDGMFLPNLRGFFLGTAGEQSGATDCTAFACIDSGFYGQYDHATLLNQRLNAVACGYGFNADKNQGHIDIQGLSGDSCMSLLRCGGVPGSSAVSNIHATTVKAEAWGPGLKIPGMVAPHDMEPVVLVDDFDNGGLQIQGVAQCDDNAQRVDLIKVQKTNPATNPPRIIGIGFDASSAHYTNLLRDSSRASRALVNSATARRELWTYGVRIRISDLGALLLQEGAAIQTIGSNGSVHSLISPNTDTTLTITSEGNDGTHPVIFPVPIRLVSYTTVGRPSASGAGAGATYYDTTLSKPGFSDGTAWRDAAGTAI